MEISLAKATMQDSEQIHKMQIKAFSELLNKYQDYNTNPASEAYEKIVEKIKQDFSDYYFIMLSGVKIGAIRILRVKDNVCRISPMFVLPEYQGKGYAQQAIKQVESLYPQAQQWLLETIKQEAKLRYLYEKMGYTSTGKEENIQDGMDIVYYTKLIIKRAAHTSKKAGDCMLWSELFDDGHEPLDNQIKEFVNTPLWDDLANYLQQTYNVKPKLFYSRCSMDKGIWKGWNIKYKKSGKSLCTLYPKQGYFLSLVSIGLREMDEAESMLPLCSEYTQNLFMQTVSGYNGKSLAFEVKNENILHDMKNLIALRAGCRKTL